MTRLPQRRRGFSLIELLVVIALIATLAALGAGAFFRVRGSQMQSATESTLTKLNSQLDNRWKAIGEQVKDDAKKSHPGYVRCLTLAQGNPDVAQTLWMYARTKNEFPVNFPEALNVVTYSGQGVLNPKQIFAQLPNVAPTNVDEARLQSAVCFYLAMQGSGGELDGLNNQVGQVNVSGVPNLPCFVDAWGTPISFLRHHYAPEVDNAPYCRAGDPYDPFNPSRKGATEVNARWTDIIQSLGQSQTLSGMPGSYVGNRNFVSTLVSAGPNRRYDGTPYGGDDLVSFRLRGEGKKGD